MDTCPLFYANPSDWSYNHFYVDLVLDKSCEKSFQHFLLRVASGSTQPDAELNKYTSCDLLLTDYKLANRLPHKQEKNVELINRNYPKSSTRLLLVKLQENQNKQQFRDFIRINFIVEIAVRKIVLKIITRILHNTMFNRSDELSCAIWLISWIISSSVAL